MLQLHIIRTYSPFKICLEVTFAALLQKNTLHLTAH